MGLGLITTYVDKPALEDEHFMWLNILARLADMQMDSAIKATQVMVEPYVETKKNYAKDTHSCVFKHCLPPNWRG